MKKILLLIAILFSTNSFAVEFKGKFLQGHFIIGITEPGSKIIVKRKTKKMRKCLEKRKNGEIKVKKENKTDFIENGNR